MRFVLDNSLLLLAGTVTAVIWANLDLSSYDHFAHYLHFAANDIGMVFFFALAAKEVFEATLPGGPLASPRQALSPLAAAVGGMATPALIYVALVSINGPGELMRGWAIPCATDIAFSAMIARLIFPPAHPAIPFLLLVAIADDALGLVILAVFYPSGPLSLPLLAGLMAAAVLLALWLRRRGTRSFWPYVIGPGALSWAALYLGGFHPALALVPIVPLMPHAASDLGLFDRREHTRADTLNRFEHWWATPVQIMLFFFGLANAGVPLIGSGLALTTCWRACCSESRSAFCSSHAPHASSAPPCRPACRPAICSSLASPRRSVSRCRSSLRPPRFLKGPRWQRRRWARFSALSPRRWLSSPHAPSVRGARSPIGSLTDPTCSERRAPTVRAVVPVGLAGC